MSKRCLVIPREWWMPAWAHIWMKQPNNVCGWWGWGEDNESRTEISRDVPDFRPDQDGPITLVIESNTGDRDEVTKEEGDES